MPEDEAPCNSDEICKPYQRRRRLDQGIAKADEEEYVVI
jgi:hypothetical protein